LLNYNNVNNYRIKNNNNNYRIKNNNNYKKFKILFYNYKIN